MNRAYRGIVPVIHESVFVCDSAELIGDVVLDNARLNSYTLLAAGSVVRPGTVIPEGVMAAGTPARIIRDLSAEERCMLEDSAQHYVDYAKTYRSST